ncbi:AAA family ATPase [Microbacterium azadirachtae]|uniref:AAA family ATPase n=1 Tax=Microbacterium azadirachtae TaxID=582680 RepID=UPI003F755984
MASSLMDEIKPSTDELVQLVRLAAAGHAYGSHAFLRRIARKYRADLPTVSQAIVDALRNGPLRSASEGTVVGQPTDVDTRLPLVREEDPVILATEPILPSEIASALQQIVDEHQQSSRLLAAGLAPTRTALFVGAPGVGKTLAARWISRELGLPLLVLDLSAVMSSFLGKTGTNLRRVLDYARSTRAVLLLDELDAVAKRRDDQTEIGELKRLVTVLLQEIDSWPEGSLLLAATNHSELLDPAVWRRFEVTLEFPLPDTAAIARAAHELFDPEVLSDTDAELIGHLYRGASISNLERDILRARRNSAVHGTAPLATLFALSRAKFASLPTAERGPAAAALLNSGDLSQRAVHEITGVSRDTLRKYTKQQSGDTNE